LTPLEISEYCSISGAVATCTGIESRLSHGLAQRIGSQRRHAASAQGFLADNIESADTRQFVTRHGAVHEMREIGANGLVRKLGGGSATAP